MRIWWIFLIVSQSPMVTAESTSLSIEANSSYITVGDTVVIKCSVHNITLLSFLNGYTLSWWKDDVKLTTSSIMLSEDLKDTRYIIAINSLGETVVSILQITSECYSKIQFYISKKKCLCVYVLRPTRVLFTRTITGKGLQNLTYARHSCPLRSKSY